MSTATVTKLICAECRHENEAERIYCHNCGERLDRSAVVAQKVVEDPSEAHRRLQKMMQGPSRTRQNFFIASKLALAAAATAALVQIALPPDFPPAVKVTVPVQLDIQLENATQRPLVMNLSQQDVNGYLSYRLTSKKKALNKPLLDFSRAAVSFKQDACIIGWERTFFGYPIYSQSAFKMSGTPGKLSVVNVGGWIGRLPIHPEITRYANVLFADLWSALDRERKMLSKMNSVTFRDDGVTISSAPSQ
jgi:hypothetical protein